MWQPSLQVSRMCDMSVITGTLPARLLVAVLNMEWVRCNV